MFQLATLAFGGLCVAGGFYFLVIAFRQDYGPKGEPSAGARATRAAG